MKLLRQIREEIDSDPDLKAARLSIQVDADQNMASLAGTVQSEALRARAVELAAKAHPGLIVENRIGVKGEAGSRLEYEDRSRPEYREEEKR